jgi:predicted transcriptional regulator
LFDDLCLNDLPESDEFTVSLNTSDVARKWNSSYLLLLPFLTLSSFVKMLAKAIARHETEKK